MERLIDVVRPVCIPSTPKKFGEFGNQFWTPWRRHEWANSNVQPALIADSRVRLHECNEGGKRVHRRLTLKKPLVRRNLLRGRLTENALDSVALFHECSQVHPRTVEHHAAKSTTYDTGCPCHSLDSRAALAPNSTIPMWEYPWYAFRDSDPRARKCVNGFANHFIY